MLVEVNQDPHVASTNIGIAGVDHPCQKIVSPCGAALLAQQCTSFLVLAGPVLAGSALVTLWLIVLPLFDYYRASGEPESAALRMLFLRICLFAAYDSCFETMFTQVGALWLILIAAAFGQRFLAVSRVAR